MDKKLLKNGMRPVHPGEVLREDFLVPLGMSAHALSKALHVTPARISEIVREKRGITTDTALRLARYFGGDAKLWLNLQRDYDLKITEQTMAKIIDAEVLPSKVERALEGLINPDDLNADEQKLYFEKLGESYRAPSPIEDKYFADLRARGGLVGMDEAGNVIVSEVSKSNTPQVVVRAGWSEAAAAVSAKGGDALLMGEFGNIEVERAPDQT